MWWHWEWQRWCKRRHYCWWQCCQCCIRCSCNSPYTPPLLCLLPSCLHTGLFCSSRKLMIWRTYLLYVSLILVLYIVVICRHVRSSAVLKEPISCFSGWVLTMSNSHSEILQAFVFEQYLQTLLIIGNKCQCFKIKWHTIQTITKYKFPKF